MILLMFAVSKLLHWILNGVFYAVEAIALNFKWNVVEEMGCRNNEFPLFRHAHYFDILYENLVGILGRRSNGLSKLKFDAEFTLSEQRIFFEVPLLRHPDVPTKMWICRNFGMSDSRAVEIALRTHPNTHYHFTDVHLIHPGRTIVEKCRRREMMENWSVWRNKSINGLRTFLRCLFIVNFAELQ